MCENDKEFVLNLAHESDRIFELQAKILAESPQIDCEGIAGWNAEFVQSPPRSISKPLAERKSRILTRRKSDHEGFSEEPCASPSKKQGSLKNQRIISRERKLPSISPRVLIPKFNYIQVPIQKKSFNSTYFSHFPDISPIEFPGKSAETDAAVRNIKKIILPVDLLRRTEFNDCSPFKSSNKAIDFSLEIMSSSIKPRNFHLSSLQ